MFLRKCWFRDFDDGGAVGGEINVWMNGARGIAIHMCIDKFRSPRRRGLTGRWHSAFGENKKDICWQNNWVVVGVGVCGPNPFAVTINMVGIVKAQWWPSMHRAEQWSARMLAMKWVFRLCTVRFALTFPAQFPYNFEPNDGAQFHCHWWRP